MEKSKNLLKSLIQIKEQGYWADRIISQLEYANESERLYSFGFKEIIDKAITTVYEVNKTEGAITKKTVIKCEKDLLPLSEYMKRFTLICVAHAHIDMNWMWRFDETVSITIDTFRTMLDLMDEYPEFTFSQSQASVYRIVEEHDPQMLKQIKKRIKEGRWEVTASTWVEADKNMPSGESKAKHILYTKKYLSKLLDIPYSSFDLDYEPDTFGHSLNDPEVLANAGIKYYYHARALNKIAAYIWQSPSGAEVLIYNDPTHYNGKISTTPVLLVPSFTYDTKHDTMMYVYGVGDHGGGPSRRDLERILDMDKWPIWPNIRFGTYRSFFQTLEKTRENLPVVKGELNFIFTGCYSSQSKIKKGNKYSEALLNEAEALSAASSINNIMEYPAKKYESAWEKLLFNQFHDILTGSGKADTREYAMGEYQKVFATANVQRSIAIREISKNIDLSDYIIAKDDELMTVSEGAGVGYGIQDLKISQVCRGRGPTRVFTVFNPSYFSRNENVRIDVWNWDYDIKTMYFTDGNGRKLNFQILNDNISRGWGGQYYYTVLVEIEVQSLGYATCILKSDPNKGISYSYEPQNRIIQFPDYVLENNKVKVCFNPVNASITSYIDKSTDTEYINPEKPAGIFRYIEENTLKKMTSWIVGRYMNIEEITKDVKITGYKHGEELLRQSITYTAKFKSSELNVTVYLDKNSCDLVYDVSCEWKEFGQQDQYIPQLNFHVPFLYDCDKYKYEVPFGTCIREQADDDRPSIGFVLAMNNNVKDKSFMLYSDSKYGYRTQENSLSLTLIRGSYDPDPYPEIGMHKFMIVIGLTDLNSNKSLIENASCILHPLISMSVKPQKGTLPKEGSFLKVTKPGTCVISAIKMSDLNPDKAVVRLYETENKISNTTICFNRKIKGAKHVLVDEITEVLGSKLIIDKDLITITVNPCCISTVLIDFE
ncbi:MAG TPA: glycoside hydrolase family 38 C-terminal domain-containing protein [Clostridia bacterium]|nr:glycoside hydrolase family 38 C-terminal domain-containing protein [Clostridia bacterium]